MAIRPTFYGFEMAKTALSASQKSIDITGQNIANINTPGYSRQRVNLSSVGPGGINWKYALHPSELVGLGVNVDSIKRVRDEFLDIRFRKSLGESTRLSIKLDVLGSMENYIDEFVSSNGILQNTLLEFQNALQNLHMGSDEAEFSRMTMSAAVNLTTTSREVARKIDELLYESYDRLDFVKNEINRISQALSDINKEIKNEYLLGSASNELLDKRDLLLDQLASYGEVKVMPALNNKGEFTGGLNIYFGEITEGFEEDSLLVSGEKVWYNTFEFDKESVPARLTWADGTNADGDFITKTGEIFAYYEMINGIGDATETGDNADFAAKGIKYFANMLNNYISLIAEEFNSLNLDMPLFISSDGEDINALNITISSEWQNDPSYLIKTLESSATAGASRNDNILRMIYALKREDREFPDGYVGSFLQYVTSINAEMSLEIDYNNKRLNTADINLLTIDMLRSSVMDVDSDEEAMNLLKFQKSYNAAARFMTTLDEMLDIIVNRLGIVGR